MKRDELCPWWGDQCLVTKAEHEACTHNPCTQHRLNRQKYDRWDPTLALTERTHPPMTEIKPHDGDVLAWIDVETTGLDPHYSALLEVACILTDTQLRPLREPFHAVIKYAEHEVEVMRSECDDFVREMHDKTGLWDKLLTGRPLVSVDMQLEEYIRSVAPERRQARVAGNSVRLDLNFLETHLPLTYDHLHYRFVDVTGIEYILGQWGLAEPVEAEKDHTALGDITSSVTQLHGLLVQLETLKKFWKKAQR